MTCHRNGKLLTSHIKYYFRILKILCVQFNWIFKTLGDKTGKAGILSISHLWRNEDLVILTIKTLIPILKLIVRIFENGIVLNSKHLFALKDLFGSLYHCLNISHNLTLSSYLASYTYFAASNMASTSATISSFYFVVMARPYILDLLLFY